MVDRNVTSTTENERGRKRRSSRRVEADESKERGEKAIIRLLTPADNDVIFANCQTYVFVDLLGLQCSAGGYEYI